MIIGACGYCGTGSSVITDLLREYNGLQVFDKFEFVISYRVDGLEDLEYHLVKQNAKNISGDYAIKRFLDTAKCYRTPFIKKPCSGKIFERISKDYIDSICQIKYKGSDTIDLLSSNVLRNIFAFAFKKIFIPEIIERFTHKRSYIWPCREMYYSINPNNFYEKSKKYINNVLSAMGAKEGAPVCLDQPFEGNCPEQSFPFFEDPYAIVVDKDPRDLYLDYKYTTHRDGKFFPHDTVENFVTFYRNMRQKQTLHNRVLRLKFEELIYEYETSISKIESFLHLEKHINPKMYFNPAYSINNTQQIRNHPNELDNIKFIENELPEFLFPFEKYQNIKFTGNTFYGSGRDMKL